MKRHPSQQNELFSSAVETHGNLVFDLCCEMLGNELQAEVIWLSVFRDIHKYQEQDIPKELVRPWILQKVYAQLLLKSLPNSSPLRSLPSHPRDRLILLLRDKYGLPYSEIASALSIPESSIKLVRAQAFRELEENMAYQL